MRISKLLIGASFLLFSSILTPTAYAESFSQISMTLTDSSGAPIESLIASCSGPIGSTSLSNQDKTFSNGVHQILCPATTGVSVRIQFKIKNCPVDGAQAVAKKCINGGSLSSQTFDASQNREFAIKLPATSLVKLQVVDAKNTPINAYSVNTYDGFSGGVASGALWSNGAQWKLSSTLSGAQGLSRAGNSDLEIPVFSVGFIDGLKISTQQPSTEVKTGIILSSGPQVIKVCMPINISAGTAFPSDCYDGYNAAFLPICTNYNSKVSAYLSPIVIEMRSMASSVIGMLTAISEKKKPQYLASIQNYGPLANAISNSSNSVDCSKNRYQELDRFQEMGRSAIFDSSPDGLQQNQWVRNVLGNKAEYGPYLAVISQRIQVQLALEQNSKKTQTITCKKGSVTKKVTAIKPVCPVGYTKK